MARKFDPKTAREALAMARSSIEDALSCFPVGALQRDDRDELIRDALYLLGEDPVRLWLDFSTHRDATEEVWDRVKKARDLLRQALS
jgi:hypothetical protein